jgi:hypothetical protein
MRNMSLLLHYNSHRVLVVLTTPFHLVLSWTIVFEFGTFIFLISALTSSSQRVFGLPTGLVPNGFHEYTHLTDLLRDNMRNHI